MSTIPIKLNSVNKTDHIIPQCFNRETIILSLLLLYSPKSTQINSLVLHIFPHTFDLQKKRESTRSVFMRLVWNHHHQSIVGLYDTFFAGENQNILNMQFNKLRIDFFLSFSIDWMSNIFIYPQAHNEQLIIDHVWSINKIANRTKPGGKPFFLPNVDKQKKPSSTKKCSIILTSRVRARSQTSEKIF